MTHITDEKLWDLIDGNLSDIERENTLNLLEENEEIKEKYLMMIQIHEDSYTIDHEEPSLRFVTNVMDKIKADLKENRVLKKWMNLTKYLVLASFVFVGLSCMIVLGSDQSEVWNGIQHLGNIVYMILFACMACWLFYLFDRILHTYYSRKSKPSGRGL